VCLVFVSRNRRNQRQLKLVENDTLEFERSNSQETNFNYATLNEGDELKSPAEFVTSGNVKSPYDHEINTKSFENPMYECAQNDTEKGEGNNNRGYAHLE